MLRDRILKLIDKGKRFYQYCANGVWSDNRNLFKVNLVKTLNITVRSFLSTDIQTQACAMTYRTLLAVVPALALIFAIGRGFGFQNILQAELYKLFPSQHSLIQHALSFVDSYLNQASEGIFVGVGIVFLLWTIINLVSNVENAFNLIWNVREGRSFGRKITDYTAMLLILPVLLICGGGLSMFLSTTLQSLFDVSFMTPVITAMFEFGSFVFMCLFFSCAFMMIPNTKVRFPNALIAGLVTGIGFTVLQWLFVTGQLYVARYNAIYGSFSFLPLFLLWMQLVWVIIMSGALICYASQNIFQFAYSDQVNEISLGYAQRVTTAIAAVIVQRFVKGLPPISDQEITAAYSLPSRLVSNSTHHLVQAGIISVVVINEKHETTGYQPAVDPDKITVSFVQQRLNQIGYKNFIPEFSRNFPGINTLFDDLSSKFDDVASHILLADIKLK